MSTGYRTGAGAVVLGALLLGLAGAASAEIVVLPGAVTMVPPAVANFHSMEVRVKGPAGVVYHATSTGETLSWTCAPCADGTYVVEARTAVVERVKETDEGAQPVLRVAQVESARAVAQEGRLTLGAQGTAPAGRGGLLAGLGRLGAMVLDWLVPSAHAQDLTVSSTIPRLFFQDTSDSHAGDDFQLECQGGEGITTTHSCALIDFENNRTMWRIDSTATVVELGIGTSTPTEALHLATPQVPRILLDSSNTDFRIGGDDDVTFTFVINPDGPIGDILTLENTLDPGSLYPGVGIWLTNPKVPLHVGSHDNRSASLRVENFVAPPAGDVAMFRLVNTGTNIVRFVIDAGGSAWTFDNNPNANPGAGVNSGEFRIARVGTGVARFTLDGFGSGRFVGNSFALSHINTSSRRAKTDFAPVDERALLAKLAALPISQWRYRKEAAGTAHVGPVAEDFRDVLGLGDGEHISTVDASGVALASIKALHQVVQAKEAEIAALRAANDALTERLARLERRLLGEPAAGSDP